MTLLISQYEGFTHYDYTCYFSSFDESHSQPALIGEGKSIHLSGKQSDTKVELLNLLLHDLSSNGDKRISVIDENYSKWPTGKLHKLDDGAASAIFFKPFHDSGWRAYRVMPNAIVVNGDDVMCKTDVGKHTKSEEVSFRQEGMLFWGISTGHQVISSSSATAEDMNALLKQYANRPEKDPVPYDFEIHVEDDFDLSHAQQHGVMVSVFVVSLPSH